MSAGGLSERYVKALSGMELPKGLTLKQLHEEISAIAEIYTQGSELKEIFENPFFSDEERRAVIESLVKRLKLSKICRNVLLLLSDKKRTRLLPDIAEGLGRHVDALTGVARAKVVSATPIKKAQLKRLSKVLSDLRGGPVVIDDAVDESLIGGVVIEMAGRVYDGSVKKRLQGIREAVLSEGTLEEGR